MKQSFLVSDPESLRALAHPIRQRILLELSVRHSARAADLAEIIGEPANAISYHLRALNKAGMLVESPELARDSRDRVWKIAHPEGVYIPPEAASTARDVFTDELTKWVNAMLNESITRDPKALQGRYLGAALLTRAEAKKMFFEVAEVFERWRKHGMDAAAKKPKDSTRIFHHAIALVGNREASSSESGASSEEVRKLIN
ncbi:MAG: helix-turn-helix transcriptional regulator [Cryobacterium sp.]|nr:helix-turn-helix transcriptional regulator [Cryobacterium sp.]MBX3103469.1 helix-turn-helix transcriptional regulator [Cryobacterium sp.]